MHPGESDAQIASIAGISAASLSRWQDGSTKAEMVNLDEALWRLLKLRLFQCLYFPDEVSEQREIEVELRNRRTMGPTGTGS